MVVENRFRRAFQFVTLPREELRYGTTLTEGLWFWKRIVGAVFPRLDDGPLTDLTRTLYERFAEADAWSLFPEVRRVLQDLVERGATLALLSNWDARGRRLLRNLRLASRFGTSLFSAEVGFEKPDPRFFDLLLERVKGSHETRVMIGNHPEIDLEVPDRRGWRTLLYRPGSDGNWHREVNDWAEVPDRLKN